MAKILVVDDESFVRLRIGNILKKAGHEFVEASSGEQAIKVYRQVRPDAATLNMRMPGIDGLATLKELRQIDPSARVAIVSAQGRQENIMEAFKSGATDFVVKPFKEAQLLAAVDKLLGKLDSGPQA